jgi:hypothetical protein
VLGLGSLLLLLLLAALLLTLLLCRARLRRLRAHRAGRGVRQGQLRLGPHPVNLYTEAEPVYLVPRGKAGGGG